MTYRPKTRGELKEKLQEGISCEVASHVVSMTNIMLRGWGEFDSFDTKPSENEGWTIYYPFPLKSASCIFVGTKEECERAKSILLEHYKNSDSKYYYKPDIYINNSTKEGFEQVHITKVLNGEIEYGS